MKPKHNLIHFIFLMTIFLAVHFARSLHDYIVFNLQFFPQFRPIKLPKWNISIEFLRKIYDYCKGAPFSSLTGNRFIILFVTSSGPHIYYTLNAYCSLSLHVSPNYYLFIALDQKSYSIMKNRSIPTILYSNKVPKVDITVLRLVIAYHLLFWGVDVIHSDSDLVYFSNPLPLFTDRYDLEITYENPHLFKSYHRYSGFNLNCGFWKMRSSPKSIIFMKNWIISCEKYHMPDQESIVKYLSSQKGAWIENNVFLYNLTNLSFTWTIRYFDNLLVTLSCSIYYSRFRSMFLEDAKNRSIYRPIVYHLAWYWSTRKPSALHQKNAWFIDFPNSKDCKKKPPNGTYLFWDNNFNLKDVKEIPVKFKNYQFPP